LELKNPALQSLQNDDEFREYFPVPHSLHVSPEAA
jgi:hypothetical protein